MFELVLSNSAEAKLSAQRWRECNWCVGSASNAFNLCFSGGKRVQAAPLFQIFSYLYTAASTKLKGTFIKGLGIQMETVFASHLLDEVEKNVSAHGEETCDLLFSVPFWFKDWWSEYQVFYEADAASSNASNDWGFEKKMCHVTVLPRPGVKT